MPSVGRAGGGSYLSGGDFLGEVKKPDYGALDEVGLISMVARHSYIAITQLIDDGRIVEAREVASLLKELGIV